MSGRATRHRCIYLQSSTRKAETGDSFIYDQLRLHSKTVQKKIIGILIVLCSRNKILHHPKTCRGSVTQHLERGGGTHLKIDLLSH